MNSPTARERPKPEKASNTMLLQNSWINPEKRTLLTCCIKLLLLYMLLAYCQYISLLPIQIFPFDILYIVDTFLVTYQFLCKKSPNESRAE